MATAQEIIDKVHGSKQGSQRKISASEVVQMASAPKGIRIKKEGIGSKIQKRIEKTAPYKSISGQIQQKVSAGFKRPAEGDYSQARSFGGKIGKAFRGITGKGSVTSKRERRSQISAIKRLARIRQMQTQARGQQMPQYAYTSRQVRQVRPGSEMLVDQSSFIPRQEAPQQAIQVDENGNPIKAYGKGRYYAPRQPNAGNFGYKPSYKSEDYTPEESSGGFFIPTAKMPQQSQNKSNIIGGDNPFFRKGEVKRSIL